MDAPVFVSLKRQGNTLVLDLRAGAKPALALCLAGGDDARSIALSEEIGGTYRYVIDFHSVGLADIMRGTWQICSLRESERIPLVVESKSKSVFKFKGFEYTVLAKPGSSVSIKVKRAYFRLENTHEKRVRNAEKAYRLFRLLPLRSKKVIFESTSKHVFNDNPRAIYEELRSRGLGYRLIWGLVNEKTPIGEGGIAVRYFTLRYWYHLATAKYIVCNFNQYNLVKRKGQVYVQTMHGTPLKKMGLSVTKAPWKLERMKLMFESDWDYFVTPSDYFSDILRGPSYGFKGRFLPVGYPRNDVLVNNRGNAELVASVREKLGVAHGKKIILYAPTWRTKKAFDLKIDLDAMERALSDEYVLVLRAHYLEQDYVPAQIYNDFVIDGHSYANVNDMLIAADVLITDYSSIMFDYAIMGRPLLLFTWDYDRYVGEKRGTYFDLREEYPALVAMTSEELIAKFNQLGDVLTDVAAFQARFNQYERGTAARDVVDEVF